MRTIRVSGELYGGVAVSALLACCLAISCGGEPDPSDPGWHESDPAAVDPPSVALRSAGGCARLAKSGAIGVCNDTTGAHELVGGMAAPIATCNTTTDGQPGDLTGESCQPVKIEKKTAKNCKAGGKTCKFDRPTDCCSNTCLCPVNLTKCTCG